MNVLKKLNHLIQKGSLGLLIALLSKSAVANDLLAEALEGNIKDTLGSKSKFWTIFIIIDVVLAAAMYVKTKNPMVFAGVFFIVFIPTFLIKTFVF